MNTCKTIDYKISIYPSIVQNPYDVILCARIVLPNNNSLCVQEVISKSQLQYGGNRMSDTVASEFARKISSEISAFIRDEAKQDINRQL